IQNCSNEGDVSGKTTGGVGGIAAYVNNKSKIDSCLNNGKIGTSSDKYSGGIAGYVTKGPDIKISNCENKGVIVANEQAGGIVGITTDISSIENCKNSGNVSAGDTGMAGGIAGSTSQSTVKKCSNTASVHGRYAGGVIGNDAYSTIDNCSGGKAAITSPAHSIGFTGHSFKMEVPENGSSGRILGSHQGAGPGKYTILILSSESDDDNTLGTIGICGYTTTMPLLKITSGTFYGDPLAGNRSTIILEEGASWGERKAGAYCRGGVEESTRIAVWTLQ
ncbi:MAG: GLUG motif-containing protein, partial [Candidatus Ornithospirochaeta sp.]|nr:GLUG motif-containing protein [Candidatus Ornithospirochaeta sp.]